MERKLKKQSCTIVFYIVNHYIYRRIIHGDTRKKNLAARDSHPGVTLEKQFNYTRWKTLTNAYKRMEF